MTDLTTSPQQDALPDFAQLSQKLTSSSPATQLQSMQTLVESGEQGIEVLIDFLRQSQNSSPNWVQGKVYQILTHIDFPNAQDFLQTHFPAGVVPLKSEANIDYSDLQQLLIQQKFQQADYLTLEKLCELAGKAALARKWLYFSEVRAFPCTDLQTIDLLWQVYSQGKFGYSAQRKLWLSVNKNWEKLWPKMGWRKQGVWTRYPQEFTWDLSAPVGHLPLSNQLRGVRVIETLLSHPAWLDSEYQ
ncbi:MAG: GUN4 N-terminal ARM-like repeat domain-containing protein [Microcoleaceae cyanobacterium]